MSFRGRRVVDEGLRTVGSDQFDATLLEHRVADLLNHKIAGEPARRLHDYGPDAVAFNALEHCREAGPRINGVRRVAARLSRNLCGILEAIRPAGVFS